MTPAALLLSAMCLCAQMEAETTIPKGDTLKAAGITSGRRARAALDSGAPALRVSAEAIVRSGARDLHEVLRTLPGLTVQDYGGIGGLKTVSVRGLGASHTAVSVDGVLMRDAQHGSIDLSQFDLDDVGGISVEIGSPDDLFKPASAFTSGGVVSVDPVIPDFSKAAVRGSGSFTWGSFSTCKGAFHLDRLIAPGWSITATGSLLGSRGDYPYTFGKTLIQDPVTGETVIKEQKQRREGSDVTTGKASLRLQGNTARGGTILASVRFLTTDRGLPGNAILYTMHPTERLADTDLTAQGSYLRQIGRRKLRFTASYRRAHTKYTDSSAVYSTPVDDRYLQQTLTAGGILQWDLSLQNGGTLMAVLCEDIDLAGLKANTVACPDPVRLGSVTALSAQYSRSRIKITASAAGTLQREWISSPTTAHSSAAPPRRHLSPSLSASWSAAPGLHLRLFAKDGFRVPTFNDLYYDRVGSIHLVPEKAFQAGGGLTWEFHPGKTSLYLTADAYHNRVRDKIVAVPTMFVWRMRNVGKVSMDGLDLSASLHRPLYGPYILRAEASWSLLHAVDLSDRSAKNYRHQIPYTPRSSGALSISAGSEALSVCYTLLAVGRRWYLAENTPSNALPAYFDHSIALRKTFPLCGRQAVLSAEVLNISGVNYEIVRSYPMPGRQARLSLRINL